MRVLWALWIPGISDEEVMSRERRGAMGPRKRTVGSGAGDPRDKR